MGNYLARETGNPQHSHDPLPALQELEREITLNPFSVSIVFECLSFAEETTKSPDNSEAEEGTTEEKDARAEKDSFPHECLLQEKDPSQVTGPSEDGRGAEQLMRVAVRIPCQFSHHLMPQEHRCQVIVVADNSGSMAGNPWKQVQSALVNIISTSFERSDIIVDVVVYSQAAEVVHLSPDNYQSKISQLKAGGLTSFMAAMARVESLMKQKAGQRFNRTAIMFMTDGMDTDKPKDVVNKSLQRWKDTLHNWHHEVTVHTVGFTNEHDFQFLQELCTAGSKPGLFRYCEPGDGPEMLKRKVEELFDYTVNSVSGTVDVVVRMNGENRILGPDARLQTHTVQGDIIHTDQEHSTEKGEITVQTEMWVWVPDLASLPAPVFTLTKTVVTNGESHTIKLPCVNVGVERKVVTEPADKVMWRLNVMSRNTDVLATKIANAIRDKKDMRKLQGQLTRLQDHLSNMQVFGRGIGKDVRAALLASMKDIQTKIDTMHGMLAQYSRGETASVSILARAHDLRYQAQFTKSRRQRVMDKRAVQNVHMAKADEAKLDQLAVNEAEISQLSQEAVDFFFCALSQVSVVDILRDVENKENAIGFGLAVCRPEHAVDDPTSLQLCLVSGTLVSRSSMLDALEFKVNLAGHMQAHNGFNFFRGGQDGDSESNSLGYATVGMGREPINAWLPLFVSPSHWERVKVILKASLGYLCTLDPLGFDWRQLDVPFMVLGAMICQLSDTTAGVHQLRLLFSFLRTCVACREDFNLTDRHLDTVRDFLQEPKGRFKNVIPNLCTLIGYIAALPVSKSRKILGYDEEGRDPDQLPTALWYAIVAEMLRRASGTCFKTLSDGKLNLLVDLLLHGRNNSLIMQGKVQEAKCSATKTSNNGAGKVQQAACSATVSMATASTEEVSSSATDTSAETSSETQAANDVVISSSSAESSSESAALAQAIGDEQSVSSLSQHTSAYFTILCGALTMQDADLTIQEVETVESKGDKPSQAEAAKPAVEFEHCAKMDSWMEIWARAELCALQNKSQEKKVSAARKQVNQWLKEGRQMAGIPEPDSTEDKEEEVEPLDCDTVDSSMLEIAAKLLTRLSGRSQLPLSSLPGAMAFLHAWLSTDRDFAQMSDGLPPSPWIDDVKAAVVRLYSVMNDYVAECRQQVSKDHLEEVVVVEGVSEAGGVSSSRYRNKNGGNEASDDDEGESDDEDYGHLEEDDAMKVLKRRQQEHRSHVTLPMILHVLDPSVNKMKVTRAMLCQAVASGNNARAREAAGSGRFQDLKNIEGAEVVMQNLHSHLVKMCTVDNSSSILWLRANTSLLSASTVWAFVGYLMNTYKERDVGFSWLLSDIMGLPEGTTLPCLADKVRVMLTGLFEGHEVLSRGNSCIPGKDIVKKLEKILGEEAWGLIDVELRGNLKIHVYRESDIPNRHGHCNSNPYIPPALRLKLGLPPLSA